MMTEAELNKYIASIPQPDGAAMEAARSRQAKLAKPPHSLGRLEDLSVQLAGIAGHIPEPIRKKRILIFSSDNGIVAERVASAPQSVTLAQTVNFTRGMTGVATLARHFGVELDVIDVGINADFVCEGVRDRKISHGTRNFAVEPAMTREECLRAVSVGIEAAERAKADGMDIIGIGEMGIGNTSTSSAVLSALLGLPAEDTVSRGGGINDASFIRKKEIIDSAVRRYDLRGRDVLTVLSAVGGFDIAAMCGAFIGAARMRLPVVIDGFISVVAALCARMLAPVCAGYMIPSHASAEKGYRLAIERIGLAPMLLLNMRLGEGSGCPIAFEIVDAAVAVLREMATFEEAAITDDYLDEIRSNRRYQGEA